MNCSRCGENMREKDIITGKDQYGDPIYNRYAFCDQCKIKKKIENKIKIEAPVNIPRPVPAKPPKKQPVPPRDAREPKKIKRFDGCFNSLIALLAVLIVLVAVFIALYLNKSKIPFLNSRLSKSPKTASVQVYPVPARDMMHGGITYGELLKIGI